MPTGTSHTRKGGSPRLDARGKERARPGQGLHVVLETPQVRQTKKDVLPRLGQGHRLPAKLHTKNQ